MRDLTWALLAIAVIGPPATRGTARDGATTDRQGSAVEGLHAENVEVRRHAALAIRRSDKVEQRQALPVLIELLMKEEDGQVRLAVLDTVTALGPDAVSAVPALIHTMRTSYGGQGKEELHQDYRSGLALAAVGKPAVEGLRSLLNVRKENVRAETVMALGRIGPDARAAVPELIPLLGDRSERIRRETSRALARIVHGDAEPVIVATADQDPVIRARAVECLGLLTESSDQVQRAILRCSDDSATEVRAAAVRAMTRLKLADDLLLPILTKCLSQTDEAVRLAVVNLLVERPTLLAGMAPELAPLLTADDAGVSRHAAFLLSKLGAAAAPFLRDALRHPQSRIDQIAVAWAQVGPRSLDLLMEAVEDQDPRVRRGAALALGQARPLAPGTVPRLTLGLNDPDLDVKSAFLTAIQAVGTRAGESVPTVRAMLQDESADIRLKVIVILAQSAARDERLLADLTGLLDDTDPRVQRQTIDTIRSLGPLGRKTMTAMIGRLGSPDQDVRLAATEYVASHGQLGTEAVPALSTLLDDPAPALRVAAARTLGGLGKAAQPAFARLASLLGDSQPEVREVAALTLGSLEFDAGVIRPHLAKALRDDESEVRRAAMKAIQRQGLEGAIFLPDIILLAGSKENSRSVGRLLRPFERAGPDARSLPELVEQLAHEQESVRLLAIKFLGLAGRRAQDALPALERLREDPSAEVRKQAEVACTQIKKTSGGQ